MTKQELLNESARLYRQAMSLDIMEMLNGGKPVEIVETPASGASVVGVPTEKERLVAAAAERLVRLVRGTCDKKGTFMDTAAVYDALKQDGEVRGAWWGLVGVVEEK